MKEKVRKLKAGDDIIFECLNGNVKRVTIGKAYRVLNARLGRYSILDDSGKMKYLFEDANLTIFKIVTAEVGMYHVFDLYKNLSISEQESFIYHFEEYNRQIDKLMSHTKLQSWIEYDNVQMSTRLKNLLKTFIVFYGTLSSLLDVTKEKADRISGFGVQNWFEFEEARRKFISWRHDQFR